MSIRILMLASALTLMACQSASQLDQLTVASAAPDASLAPDSSTHDSGPDRGDASAPCSSAGAACDPVKQCGCAADQTCQVDTTSLEPACVAAGERAAWSSCRAPEDCPAGQTCDRGSCRSYCNEDADCDDGACVPAQSASGELIESLHVCWKRCDPEAADGCADGTACRELKTPYATRGSFCVAPYDPCPTIEDGVCDEPQGSGTCVAGSDDKDCACAPQLEGAACDPIAQCGCTSAQSCVPVREAGASNASTARCEEYGYKQRYEACAASSDCALGLSCDLALGLCVNTCMDDEDCVDGACSKDLDSDKNALGFCRPSCNRRTGAPCGDQSVCARFDDTPARVISIRSGDFCWVPLSTCPMDGVCDEQDGTRLCTDGSDDRDCCTPPSPDGECEPVSQCGCSSEPDTQCRHLPFSTTTECLPRGHAEPWSHCADLGDNCPPGYECGNGVCRKYCATHADCGSLGNMCVPFNDRKLQALPGIGACFMACDYTKPESCPSNLVCARTHPDLSFCIEPYDPCPSEYLDNDICDDTREGGSRVCALGTDPDC